MAPETSETLQTKTSKRSGPGTGAPLQSERGTTTIAATVVQKVAGIAAREVPGVHSLGGGEREAAVDLTLVVEYGESIPQVCDQVRENIIKRIEGIAGLSVTEVNVTVNDLYFPGDEAPSEPQRVS